MDQPPAHDVVVIGGGITGLATAFYVTRLQPDASVVVLEAGPRAGGKVASVRLCGQDIDAGPDAFLARVAGGVDLAADLGLGDSLVAPATGRAWLWSRDALHPLPGGLVLGVPSDPDALEQSDVLSVEGLARALAGRSDDVTPGDGDDVSVAEGIGSHLGPEVVERLVDPLLGGINASDCATLSLRSASAELFAAAQQPHLMAALRDVVGARGQIGVSEERPVFLTPRRGVHQLVSELVAVLGGRIRVNTAVSSIERTGEEWRVTVGSEVLRAHSVVVAVPAALAASILRGLSEELVAELSSIRTASVALTLFAYPRSEVSLPEGSGMLVARPDGHLMTAASWWSQKWPHLDTGDHVIVRASAGRDGDERFRSMSDAELVDALHHELLCVLDIRARPTEAAVSRWIDGFPQYDVGHAARVERIEAHCAALPGLVLAGASYRGIGLPACIRDANAAARRVVS